MPLVQTYLQTRLAPRLKTYGLNKDQRQVFCADVGERLTSLLAHWGDTSFRRAILTLGIEEATFWEPREAPLEIRALVVLGVRNSLIETLNADVGHKRQVLPDEDVPALTAEAIEYFRQVDLREMSALAGNDLFGALPRRFPNAWQCLSVLGQTETSEADYQLHPEKAEPLSLPKKAGTPNSHTRIVANGMDAALDRHLAHILLFAQSGQLPAFASDGLRNITRNPVKLLGILDHLLRHEVPLVTTNFVFSSRFVARRTPLLRPAHTQEGVARNWRNFTGVSARHEQMLALVGRGHAPE